MRTLIVVALCIYSLSASTTDTLFPIPENLEDNVAFWKIIYTKTSLREGLLHDRDYPLIIYGKLFIGTLYGKKLDGFTDKYKKDLAQSIKRVRSTDRATWGIEEKRIAALFNGYPPGILKDAENRIRFQVGQRERFLEGVRRSGALLDTIQSILKVYKIPSRLAYLPHVESSFDNSAYSHAGAAGLWQFMPATGKEYLRINHVVDERRDPVLSTIAAARLLSQNYSTLKSWPLAITAYNYGLTGVYSAVKKIGTNDIGEILTKHESPTFRFASKNFYSCFIAASEIAENAERYFGKVNYIQKKNPVSEVELNVSLYTFEIARMLGISESEIAELNPSILPGVFTKQIPVPVGTKIRINNLPVSEKIEKQIVNFFKIYPKSEKRIMIAIRSSRSKTNKKSVESKTSLAERETIGADSIYDVNLEWPDQRYLKYYKENLVEGGLAASTFRIISPHSSGQNTPKIPRPKGP
jgi:membrane-bound lytic murein transglycosylase D